MKSLNEYKLELEQIEADLRSMKAELEQEDRDPTDEERMKMVDMLDRADNLDKLIETEERRLALEDRFRVPADDEKEKAEASKIRQWRNIADSRIQSVSAAITTLLLVLHQMGIGSLWMTGPMQAKENIEKILKITEMKLEIPI